MKLQNFIKIQYFYKVEYTDAKEKLDSDGLHILKYLQKRTVDQNYNQKRQSKQHEEDTTIPDIASDRDNKIDEPIKEDRDVETIDHFETGDDHKLDETIDEKKRLKRAEKRKRQRLRRILLLDCNLG